MDPFGIYLHIPFCRHRCAYCDFNTYAGQEARIGAYIDALCAEIRALAAIAPQRIHAHTIFFGGGTPSLVPATGMARVLETIDGAFDLAPDAEISLEANPGTLTPAGLRDLRALGFNRISLGMQSAHPDDLRLLERQHDTFDVIHAVAWARQAGFENLNLDLMFGLPEQTLARWGQTLETALSLAPEHLSLYALTLEHGTPFQHWAARGLIPAIDDDLAADMYDLAEERLAGAGYGHYEISNWARVRSDGSLWSCRHNLQYWRNWPYLGFGAGAHGYVGGYRTANVLAIPTYIARCAVPDGRGYPFTPATANATPIDARTDMQETMMVGLRLLEEGVSARGFAVRYGQELTGAFGKEIETLIGQGLLEWGGADGDALRLTRRGHLLGNQVFIRFVGEPT